MNKFTTHTGTVIPLDRSNVDTDAIIPKQYLKSISRAGFGVSLFDDWRYLDEGGPDSDHSKRRENKDFVLNKPEYKDGTILVARDNFGCGSSREHAVWALDDYGIRAVIAPSFADIFFNNSFKNGLLPIALGEEVVDKIFAEVANKNVIELTIDLEKQVVVMPDNSEVEFVIDEYRRYRLLNGLDDIGITLQYKEEIQQFEKKHHSQYPWL